MVHETAPPQYFFIGQDSADLAFDPHRLLAGSMLSSGLLRLHQPGAGFACAGCCAGDEVKGRGKRVSFDPNFRNIMTKDYDPTLRYVAGAPTSSRFPTKTSSTVPPERPELRSLRALNPTAPILFTRGSEGAELHSRYRVRTTTAAYRGRGYRGRR
jgi:fructokinase